jgi:hypothetical protein
MLFQQDTSDAINAAVIAKHQRDDIHHTQHPKMYQEELKLRWDNLPQTEKEDWDAQAATATLPPMNLIRYMSMSFSSLIASHVH